MKANRILAPMFTHDESSDQTVFVLNSYARLWPTAPIQFLVPYSDPTIRTYYEHQLSPDLEIEFVRTPSSIRETIANLLRRVGDAKWLFWCTSDRFPIAIANPEKLNQLAQKLIAGDLDHYDTIKLVRWREVESLNGSELGIKEGDFLFVETPINKFGLWHPQFIKSSLLKMMVAKLKLGESETVSAINTRLLALVRHCRNPTLFPVRSIIKLEEPLVSGRLTLNFEARRRRMGLAPSDPAAMGRLVVSFCSPFASDSNRYWIENKDIKKTKMLNRPTFNAPYLIYTYGGVGSKLLVRWIYGNVNSDIPANVHSHRRIPPHQIRPGQKLVYVFGDPRNTLVSFFQRRESRHDRHGIGNAGPETTIPDPEWATKAMRNLEADGGLMTQNWDLERYVSNKKDLYRLEEHFDFWVYANAQYPILFVKYEAIWENFANIAGYLDVPYGNIPPRIPRRADWTKLKGAIRRDLNYIYGPFAERLDRLPDLFKVHNGVITTVPGNEIIRLNEV